MRREIHSQERPLYNDANTQFTGSQAKAETEELENHQSPLETKNTTTFSFQDQSAIINRSSNEHNEKTATLSPLLSYKDGQSFLQQQKQSINTFHLKLKPLVLPINKRQSSQEILPQAIEKVNSPQRQYSISKKNSIVSQEYLTQQSIILQRIQTQSEMNDQNEEASSPTKLKLQYLIQKNTINFNSEEDVNSIIRIAKKNHKTKMELAYFRKFAYYFRMLEQSLRNVDKDNISQEIFNQFKLTMYNPNRIISKCDETFYIVLKGSLVQMEKNSILDNNVLKEGEEDDIEKIDSEEQLLTSNTDIFTDHDNYTTFQRYYPGDSFGEIRLFENNPLKGIIVTETECTMIEITKEGIQSILAKYQASELQGQIDFFKSFSFFKDLPVYALMTLIGNSKLKELIRGDVLYQEKENVESIYFIKSGEVEISKLIEQEINQDTQTISNNNSQIIIPILNLQNINSNSNASPLLKRKSKRGEMIPLKFIHNNKKRISLKILTQNSYFGQEEIIQKIDKRENKAVVLSPQAQIYTLNKQEFMAFIQKHQQLQVLIEENSLKEMAEEQRKKLIKKVQVKIQNRQSYDSQLYYHKTSGNTPTSQRELRSPIQRQQTSILNQQKPYSHRGYTQQFSSAVLETSNNKSGIYQNNNNNNVNNAQQYYQSQNTIDDKEMYENFSSALYIKQNIKTQPNSNRGSPKLSKLENNLISPHKNSNSQVRSGQVFFQDQYENYSLTNLTDRPHHISQNNIQQQQQQQQQQQSSEYALSPMMKKQLSRNLISPQIIKLQSGQKSSQEQMQLSTQRSSSQQQGMVQQSPLKTITSFRAFDFDMKKRGNLFDQNGNPILMIQFKTGEDTQTARKSSQQNLDDYQLQNEKRQNKTLNLKAIFKSPKLKVKNENQLRATTSRFTEVEEQKTIRNNEIQDKNQRVYYDLSPIKKQILTSLLETNKQNKINQNNHYNKSVSPLRQLPTHPEILNNIPKKFWKENQKILESNEQMVKNGAAINKRNYQRAGRQADLHTKSLLDRNIDKIMLIARQQTQVSPRFIQGQEDELCQMNIGRINVQNLEWQLKNNQTSQK